MKKTNNIEMLQTAIKYGVLKNTNFETRALQHVEMMAVPCETSHLLRFNDFSLNAVDSDSTNPTLPYYLQIILASIYIFL